jgi:hypothetical protein
MSSRDIEDMDYTVSMTGIVWSRRMDRDIKPRVIGGYNKVTLCKHTKGKVYRVDELVANAFGLEKKEILWHKNGNKLDDRLCNLKWLTYKKYFKKVYDPKEKWEAIKDIDGFFISNRGRIWSKYMEDFIKCQPKNGYLTTCIGGKFIRVHQVMAKEFLDYTPSKDTFISHIDKNKLNNTLENLEICKLGSKMASGWKKRVREKGPRPDGKIWPFNEDVIATEEGKIYEISSSTYFLPRVKSEAYFYVGRIGGKYYSVHRIVAETYLQKPEGRVQVNHIDGNKLNNHVTNLEWVTPGQNISHSINVLHEEKMVKSLQKPVICIHKNGDEIEFPGVKAAMRETGVSSGSISAVCRGVGKTAGGFRWRYKNPE